MTQRLNDVHLKLLEGKSILFLSMCFTRDSLTKGHRYIKLRYVRLNYHRYMLRGRYKIPLKKKNSERKCKLNNLDILNIKIVQSVLLQKRYNFFVIEPSSRVNNNKSITQFAGK